jgi:predicted nucleic acid-binding protein
LKIVVCDTGPILHLREADCLSILQAAGSILIPPAVDAEMARLDRIWAEERPDWIQTTPLDPAHLADARSWLQAGLLDPGEAQALALAAQISADWLLTDDAAARTLAEHQGFEVHGSVGIVLWAAATGHLDRSEGESALEALARSSLWISARVLSEASKALERIFAPTAD